MAAHALTTEEIEELELQGLGSLVCYVEQVPYNREDLVGCDDCDYVAVTNDGLDEMNRCPDCAAHARACDEEVEDHRSWYRTVAR